jgi:serine protease Do
MYKFRCHIYSTIFLLIFLATNCLSQQKKRPAQGSIEFGTEKPPIEWNEQEISPVRDVYYKIASNVIPSVVSIILTRVDTVTFRRNPFYRFFDEDDPLGFFFGPQENTPEQQERRIQGLGSGVIVSKSGYILTNYHVIAGAREIEIRLSDGKMFTAQISGADSSSDVAVVKITGDIPENLPVAYLGNSDSLRPGDIVAAIGNPFSLTSTITSGIVSALERRVGQELTYQNFIQTDAAINPGNSGGALANINGAIIGINTLIFSQTGGFMGIGFAIPINMARRVMEDLIYEGRVIRGWIGISVQELTPDLRKALGVQQTGGVLVSDVVQGEPAEKAGILAGDIILSIAETQINNANELVNLVATFRPGKELPVTLLRNGKKLEFQVKVTERTPEAIKKLQPSERQLQPRRGDVESKIGIGVEELTQELKNRLGIPQNISGVIVTQISPQITDARATLQTGDIITKIKLENKGWTEINSLKKYQNLLNDIKKGQSVVLQVNRRGTTFFVAFIYE